MKINRIVKSWELQAKSQKSFYRKAYVLEDENGGLYLQSYDTIVCGIVDGPFIKLRDGYTATTAKHINDFRSTYNMEHIYKKEWDHMEVSGNPINYNDHVATNMGNQYCGIPFACRW